jgi:hypothetical protein
VVGGDSRCVVKLIRRIHFRVIFISSYQLYDGSHSLLGVCGVSPGPGCLGVLKLVIRVLIFSAFEHVLEERA